MATPKTNEQRLDYAQKIIADVVKDVRYHRSDYSFEDIRKLEYVLQDLGSCTLRPDSDFQHKKANK
jgi:hypothetical protein